MSDIKLFEGPALDRLCGLLFEVAGALHIERQQRMAVGIGRQLDLRDLGPARRDRQWVGGLDLCCCDTLDPIEPLAGLPIRSRWLPGPVWRVRVGSELLVDLEERTSGVLGV